MLREESSAFPRGRLMLFIITIIVKDESNILRKILDNRTNYYAYDVELEKKKTQ